MAGWAPSSRTHASGSHVRTLSPPMRQPLLCSGWTLNAPNGHGTACVPRRFETKSESTVVVPAMARRRRQALRVVRLAAHSICCGHLRGRQRSGLPKRRLRASEIGVGCAMTMTGQGQNPFIVVPPPPLRSQRRRLQRRGRRRCGMRRMKIKTRRRKRRRRRWRWRWRRKATPARRRIPASMIAAMHAPLQATRRA